MVESARDVVPQTEKMSAASRRRRHSTERGNPWIGVSVANAIRLEDAYRLNGRYLDQYLGAARM